MSLDDSSGLMVMLCVHRGKAKKKSSECTAHIKIQLYDIDENEWKIRARQWPKCIFFQINNSQLI